MVEDDKAEDEHAAHRLEAKESAREKAKFARQRKIENTDWLKKISEEEKYGK